MSSPAVILEVDRLAEAAYVRFSDSEVASTVAFNDEINIDLDAYDVVVGIEVLQMSAEIPFTALTTEFHVESQKINLLRALRPNVTEFVSGLEISAATQSRSAAVGNVQAC
jgi:uncharacterized protein YuzE